MISQCLVVFWGEKWHLSLLQVAYSGTREFDYPSLLLFFLDLLFITFLLPDTSILSWLLVFYSEVVFKHEVQNCTDESITSWHIQAIHLWCKKNYLLYLVRGLSMPYVHTTNKMYSNPHRLPSSTTLTSKVEKAPTLCSRMYNHKSEIL